MKESDDDKYWIGIGCSILFIILYLIYDGIWYWWTFIFIPWFNNVFIPRVVYIFKLLLGIITGSERLFLLTAFVVGLLYVFFVVLKCFSMACKHHLFIRRSLCHS